jgi:hypothetical protein
VPPVIVWFLRGGGITGQPVRVVTDGHDGTINAARMVRPETPGCTGASGT